MTLRPGNLLCILGFALLSACSLFGDNATVDAANLIDPITLRLGESVELGDEFLISFDAFKGDSRCPEGVNCFWEGEVEVDFKINAGDATTLLSFVGFPYALDFICNEEKLLIREFGVYKIVLSDVKPYPVHPYVEVDPAEILATIHVYPKHLDVISCGE